MSVSLEALGIKSLPDANPRYCPIGASTLLLPNTAEQVEYIADAVQSKSSNSLTFTLDLSDRFIGRDIYLRWTAIPLEVERAAVTTVASTEINFHKNFFDSYKSLAMKQFGLLNAINTLSITVDGKTITTVRGSDLMEMICHFYSKEEVHRHFQSSNSNVNYSNLVPDADPWIPTVSTDGTAAIVKGSSVSENDPFSAAASDGYNSRVPFFTANGTADAGAKKMKVWLNNQMTWLPFNILGINGDVSPLYGANKMTISIDLHGNWPNRLFSTKRLALGAGATDPISPFKFTLDRASWGSNSSGEVFMHYKKFLAPQYISSQLNPRTDKWIQDYTIVQMDQRTQDVTFKAGGVKEQAINTTPFDLTAIPKKLYIALVNKRISDEDYLTDAVHFCRWDSMTVDLMGAKTTLGGSGRGAMELYMVSKANGLEMTENQALYTLGFPVCFDVSNDLGCRTNSFIGLSTADSSGKVILRVNGTVTRLHHDTEAASFNLDAAQADLFKSFDKSYEFRLIVVYAGFFCCNMNGAKFSTIESLTVDGLASMGSHVQNLMESFAPKMNTLGGSWISSLMPTLKNVGQGVFNVIKAALNNKDGLRDQLSKAYKGGAFDNHAPTLGAGFGQSQHNLIGGGSIKGWDSQ